MKQQNPVLFFILSLFICGACTPPGQTLPTLEEIWPEALKGYKEKIKAHIQDNPDSARYYIEKLEVESRRLGFEKAAVDCRIYKGKLAANQGKHDLAYMYYKQGLALCQKEKAIQSAIPALYGSIGNYHVQKGAYETANQYFYKALQYILKYRYEDRNLPLVYISLSALQSRLGQYQQSLAYAAQAEAIINSRPDDPTSRASLFSAQATAYLGLDSIEKARALLEKGLVLSREYRILYSHQNFLSNLGDVMIRQGKYKEAIPYFLEAMQVSNLTDPYYGSVLPGYGLGKAYYHLKEYNKAEFILSKSIQQAREMSLDDQRIDAHSTLTAVYQESGKHREALRQQILLMALKDSLINKEKINAINEMAIKYQTAQKDKFLAENQLKISQQQQNINQKNNWILINSCGAVLLAFLLFHINKVSKQKRLDKEKKIHILQQQHDLLQKEQQIHHLNDVMKGEENERIRIARDLHDGIVSQLMGVRFHFNSALQKTAVSLPDTGDFDRVLHFLDHATAELRRTAHNLMPETVLQAGLLAALHTYCTQMTGNPSTQVHFQHYGNYRRRDPDTELSLYRIIQELVQNALKHAEARSILVELSEDEGILCLMVEDDGKGFASADPGTGTGRGLKSIYSRIKALNASIHISSTPKVGSTVQIELETPDPS